MNSKEQSDYGHLTGSYRLTRRSLLRASGISVIGLSIQTLLAACGGSSKSSPAATSAASSSTQAASTSGASSSSAASSAVAAASPSASPGASTAGAFQVPTIGSGSHSLKILMWSHFVPAYDDWFDKWAKDWGSKNKVNVSVDHIPTNTIPTRVSAEVSANSGHDLVLYQTGSDVHVFADKMLDVTGLAGYLGDQNGGWEAVAKTVGMVEDKWKAIPDYIIRFPGLYRKDLFDEQGVQPVVNWEDLINVGKTFKPKGHQVGVAISQTGDSNSSMYSILWSYGGAVTAEDGQTITISSPETKAAIEYVTNLYKEAMTPEVLSWDDASNNRLLDSGVACWIHNPISAYRSASKEMQDKIYISETPKGPKGQFCNTPVYSWGVMSWTKEQDAAEKFLVDYFGSWKDAFEASTGYNHPLLVNNGKKPMPILGSDPKLQPLQDFGKFAQTIGYPGPSTAAAGQVNNTYVIPNMFAKACTGMSADDAMAWAEEQIKSVYAKYPKV